MKSFKGKPIIAVLGSHSALDVCFGAKKLGFKTLVVAQSGRDKTYTNYYKSIVDEVLYVDQFKDVLTEKIQKILLKKNCIFIPHRSFEVYINDYDAIENKFKVPMFGNRFLLRSEERAGKPNQYDILKNADIKFPKRFIDPKKIDRLVIVKALEKKRKFERAFFLAKNYYEYKHESERLIKEGKITREVLSKAVVEEFVLGAQVNFNFFYSPVKQRLELIGTDTRRQTNLDGLLRLPENQQEKLLQSGVVKPSFEEAGHIAVTVLESLLEQAFEIGERFVNTAKEMFSPGIIGPFGLQTVITAGPSKKEIIVFDVAPRMPGSPGISATPYSAYLYGRSVSMGERVAMEIKEAMKKKLLSRILT